MNQKGEQEEVIAWATAVKDTHERDLLKKENVVGVGIGFRHKGGKRTDDVVLVVMVEKKVPKASLAPEDFVPSEIDGVPVDVQDVGQIRIERGDREGR